MLLCEGEDIDEQLVFAEDLISFLVQQVGSANVDTVLMAPQPAPGSTPMCRGRSACRLVAPSVKPSVTQRPASAPGYKTAQAFYIGDGKPSASKTPKSVTPFKKDRLFCIGDAKPLALGGRRSCSTSDCTKTFYIGDGDPSERRRCSSSTTTPTRFITPRRRHDLALSSPRRCRNLLSDEASAQAVAAEASHVPEYSTPVKRLFSFGRPPLPSRRQPQIEDWKSWVCTLGCTARERDTNSCRSAN